VIVSDSDIENVELNISHFSIRLKKMFKKNYDQDNARMCLGKAE